MKNRLSAAVRPIAGLTLALLAFGPVAAQQDEPSPASIDIPQGTLRGATEGGVERFFGIPYAAAPVGERRFAPPGRAPTWSEPREASDHGAACPQNLSLDADRIDDEDCLFVNVQRPTGTTPDDALPVLVLIHGGGLVGGSGNNEDLDAMVADNGIVGVTMNYRLGTLGFLALPDSESEADGVVANWGLRDQRAALEWVRDNIAAFGGDPTNVTIGGESAGGFSACAHLAAPGSQGLFARAFMMSTYCSVPTLEEAREATAAIAGQVGCPTEGAEALACLRDKPARAFLDTDTVYRDGTSGTNFLPVSPYDALLAGELADVPLMIGANRDEGRSFVTDWPNASATTYDESEYREYVRDAFGDDADAVLQVYPWPDDPTRYTGTYLVADLMIQNLIPGPGGLSPCKSLDMTERLAARSPTWAYEFAHSDASGWFDVPGYVWGAGHATELPYLIPNRGNKALNSNAFGADERELAGEMRARWGAFVVAGDPNVEGRPDWPRFEGDAGAVLSLQGGGDSRIVPAWSMRAAHRCDFWERVL